MDHSWRPRPIQGTNICPTCSISHFPFCPPHPHPHPSTHHGPNFGPNLGPPHPGRPVYGNHPDPYHDPGHWGRNTHVDYSVGYNNINNCYDNVNDGRSSKRLRVDGVYPSSYGGESGGNFSKTVGGGGEMRQNFVNGYGGQNLGYVDGENARMMHKMEAGYPVETGCGYGTGYRVTPDVELSRLENEFQSRVRHSSQFGQVAKPPPAFSHGGFGQESDGQNYAYRPPNYEYGQSNGANMVTPGQYPNTNPSFPAANVQPGHLGYGYQTPQYVGGVRQPINQNVRPFVPANMNQQSEYGNEVPRHVGHGQQPPQGFDFQPPLPSSPPPPLPKEPPVHWSAEHKFSASPRMESPSLFPVQYRSSAAVQYSYPPTPDSHVLPNPHLDNYKMDHASRGTFQGDSHSISTSFGQHSGGRQSLPSQSLPSKNIADKPKTVDAVHLFKQPHRTSRPDHFVIILRGLPGSGKSYIAKMLRDLELEHGGNAPRIHSMDDYFMTEVDKTEENETSKALARGKKSVTKTVIEYCYEPEMEEAYRSSMLKAFKKTLEEGVYTFVIVDDRNLRVADFAQFWATAKRSGYEAYVLEAPYKDPAGCTARNVHGFTQDEVEKMAAKWEEASSLYLQLDVKSLFHGDDLKEGNIEEVDMDTEDEDVNESSSKFDERQAEKTSVSGNSRADVSPKDERNSDAAVVSNGFEEVKELGRSKWSDDLDDDGDERTELLKGKASVLSGLLGTYGKEGKSVHWGDQSERSGFSIGAVKKAKAASLIIGPGTGYNLKSNPLPEEENTKSGKSEETKKHKMFKERLQAEHDSFRAVFDRRRHRVGVLTEED